MPKIAVVLLTWKRMNHITGILDNLAAQTYKDFDVVISNGNMVNKYINLVEAKGRAFDGKLNVFVRHDGNEFFAFRRLFVGRALAEAGYDIVFFLDDDVNVPSNYVEKCLNQYEPKTYQSGFAWKLFNGGENYYSDRERVWDREARVQYCGTGVSMIDAKLFLEDNLIFKAPLGALKIEDLWMSFYVDHILRKRGWRLRFMNIDGANIGGADRVALYKQVLSETYTKKDFLHELVAMGWKL